MHSSTLYSVILGQWLPEVGVLIVCPMSQVFTPFWAILGTFKCVLMFKIIILFEYFSDLKV